ncbi:MAG TPA: hypothetical protein VLU73_10265 [Methylococcaceae bacterium]|jgi:hypothetical protein|nr:hypothetical protein [Methylococcaceae bacterium]
MNETHQDSSQKSGLRHETDDVDAAKLGRVVGGLVALLAFATLGGWALLEVLLPATPASPPAVSPRAVAPVEPRLQAAPPRDLATLRAEEDRILHSSEWIDRQAGIARIPIEQAMALLLTRSKPGERTKP